MMDHLATISLAFLPVRFDAPGWLIFLVLLIPTVLMSLRAIGTTSRGKVAFTTLLRVFVILGLVFAMADPYWVKHGKGLTVAVIIDRSGSIPGPMQRESVEFLRRAAEQKERPEDRLSVITVARGAEISGLPSAQTVVDTPNEPADRQATNLEEGIDLAIAIAPDDTSNRFVIASDGNETEGSLLRAAEIARANKVPIDVVLLPYAHANEVIFEQIVVPPRAREGRTAAVRMMLRSQAAASGEIRLSVNDEPIDLNGDEPGTGMRVQLEAGIVNGFETLQPFDAAGPHEFEAVFVPDDPAMDTVDRNNRAIGVTFVGGRGRVLVLDDGATNSETMVRALRESDISVDVESPDAWTGGLVQLSAYDAVILANVPIYAFANEQDEMLHAYVHDLGGGLIMLGGDRSFGAGGWIDSETAKVLPVELNPPQTRQLPAGALALIMHSCEMAQGNFWGQQVAEAAIQALSRLDYVGIVEYGWGQVAAGNQGGPNIAGCRWTFPMQKVGNKATALQATKQMVMGDMPSFAPSMQLAHDGLNGVPAAQRHAIIISDGDPAAPGAKLLNDYVSSGITVTAVMVGGHGGPQGVATMKNVANTTGGRYYNVTNPKNLPQIFFKEATLISRSLIQEGQVFPAEVTMSVPGPMAGVNAVPAVDGYVLTAAREGLAQTTLVIPTTDANDPLYAYWNYGLGRSVAYTSDASRRWGSRWVSWGDYSQFWEQTVRWAMRPSTPTNMHVNTRIEGDRAIVELEALDHDAANLNFMRTNAVVIDPKAGATALTLQQTGPGRYTGEFPVSDAGAYLVNIVHETGAGDALEQGSIQAAVNVPYPREYRAVKHNGALLKQLADSTGGRMIDLNSQPELVNLFDPGDLEPPSSPRPVWDIVAIIAASLLLLDVAARRISVTREQLAGVASRWLGRRRESSGETLEAFRRTKTSVSKQRVRDEATSQVRFEADDERGDPAFSVEDDASGTGAPRPRPGLGDDAAPADPGKDDDDENYTSRLLAAKRRAQKPEDDGGANG